MLIRDAVPGDAADLARLINMAGEGLPQFLWRKESEETGLDPIRIGGQRAARDEGAFSYRHARMAETEGSVTGMALAYRLDDPGEPVNLTTLPAVVRPLVELEALAPGSWYVNAVAAYPEYRGQGIGMALMEDCERAARADGAGSLSLIVAGENSGAHRLYLRLGYRDISALPLVTWPGGPDGGDWILMARELLY